MFDLDQKIKAGEFSLKAADKEIDRRIRFGDFGIKQAADEKIRRINIKYGQLQDQLNAALKRLDNDFQT